MTGTRAYLRRHVVGESSEKNRYAPKIPTNRIFRGRNRNIYRRNLHRFKRRAVGRTHTYEFRIYRYRRGEHFSPFVLNGAVQDSYRAVEIVKQAAPRVLPTAHSGAAGVTRERRPRPNIRTRPIGKSRNRGAGLETRTSTARRS